MNPEHRFRMAADEQEGHAQVYADSPRAPREAPRHDVPLILFSAIIIIVLVLAILFWPLGGAKAHEAMSGWPYPAECCGGEDCWQLPENAVIETPAGFTIKASGEFVTRANAKPSGDEFFHLCRYPGPKIRCLFFPNRGF